MNSADSSCTYFRVPVPLDACACFTLTGLVCSRKKDWAFGLTSRGSILSGRSLANADLGDQPEQGCCVLWRIREELSLTPDNPDLRVYLKLNCRGGTPMLVAA